MISEVYNIDCMEGMKQYPDKYFTLAVVDPPYGIGRDEGFEGFGGFGKPIKRKQYKGDWDKETPSIEYFNQLLRISKNVIIWGGQFFTDKLPQAGHWIFWDKINTMPTFGDGELAYTNFQRGSVKQVTIQYNVLLGKEDNRIHATQKPIALYKWIYRNYLPNGGKVLDTHGGSMSNVIAALETGNIEITCFEIDKDYYDSAKNRIENHFNQGNIFFEKPVIIFK